MSIISSIEGEYRRYKALAEAAIAQVSDEELGIAAPGGGNSIDMMVRHVAANLHSRFTDFRTSDGEKPWRRRDEEFEGAALSRADLLATWETGWRTLFDAIGPLTDADLGETVTIRQQPLRIDEALHRSLAHSAYHVGQIVYVAKATRGEGWRCLSIPRGMSEAFNKKAAASEMQTAAAHADWLAKTPPTPSS